MFQPAGEPRSHGGRLQVEHGAHAQPEDVAARARRATCSRSIVGVSALAAGKASHAKRHQGHRPLHAADRPDGSPTTSSTTSSRCRSRPCSPRSGWRNTPTRPSPVTRSAPAPSSSITGPPDQEIVIKRNPELLRGRGALPRRVHFEFASSSQTALLQLEDGKIDVLGNGIPSAQYVQIDRQPDLEEPGHNAPQIAWYYIFMNVNVKPFDNQLVRQAINYAVDTSKIQKLFYGQAQPLNQVYPKGMTGHVDDATFYTLRPGQGQAAPVAGGLPQRLPGHLLPSQRRPHAEARREHPERPVGGGHQRHPQATRRVALLEPHRAPGLQGADRPHRLVHGLSRPVRLDRAAVQQVVGHDRRRSQRELVVEPAGRGPLREGPAHGARPRPRPGCSSRCSRSSCNRPRSCRSTSRSSRPCPRSRPAASTRASPGPSSSRGTGRSDDYGITSGGSVGGWAAPEEA